MNKRIVLTILVALLISTNTIDVFASTPKSIQEDKNNFNSAVADIVNLTDKVQALDEDIQKTLIDIDSNKKSIELLSIALSQSNVDLATTNKSITSEENIAKLRMREMYMYGSDYAYSVELLLSITSFSQIFETIEIIQKLSEFDRNLMAKLNYDKNQKVNETKIFENNKITANIKENELDNKLSQLSEQETTQNLLIKNLNIKKQYYADNIAAYAQQVDVVNKLVLDTTNQIAISIAKEAADAKAAVLINPYTSNSLSLPALKSSSDLVNYAYTFLGTPYVWGGEQPGVGFDCSGLMQYVYNHFGIPLTRTTYTQINEGQPVINGILKPGDLIFFGTLDNPHHVAMYAGNGCIIEAPETGQTVKIAKLNGYLGARRIINTN